MTVETLVSSLCQRGNDLSNHVMLGRRAQADQNIFHYYMFVRKITPNILNFWNVTEVTVHFFTHWLLQTLNHKIDQIMSTFQPLNYSKWCGTSTPPPLIAFYNTLIDLFLLSTPTSVYTDTASYMILTLALVISSTN